MKPAPIPNPSELPTLCDQRDRCCGVPVCSNAGLWTEDPYEGLAVYVQGHWHSEPACAWWDCTTTLTRAAMATMQRNGGLPPAVGGGR